MTSRDELERQWQEAEARIQAVHKKGLQGSPEEALLLQEQDAIEYEIGTLDCEERK